MLQFIFTAIGGIAKDVIVVAEKLITTTVDEVFSIPDAISTGFDHGLFTGSDQLDDPHTLTPEQVDGLATPKFGQK